MTNYYPAKMPEDRPPVTVLNGRVYFSGRCEECRLFCAAVCCKGAYNFISLTEAEARSGRYAYYSPVEGCSCEMCTEMRKRGIRYTLARRRDGTCLYLDGENRCSIYENRPEVCRKYTCKDVDFVIRPSF